MNTELATRRAKCVLCLRPQNACICKWVTPITTQTEVLILQHPLEVDHAKNTARLLHLSLPGSRLLTGEAFDEASLREAMTKPRYTVLLYPSDRCDGHATPAALEPTRLTNPGNVRLVVLDGTWRKSRKMLHLSPLLQALPRFAIANAPPSGYAIRKAHKPGQLSTLEAACAALTRLEDMPGKFQPMLDAFGHLIAQQQEFLREK